jgi:hypothetical protein
MEFSILTISAFVVIFNDITKTIADGVFKKSINRFIPLFSIFYGLALGLIAWAVKIPDFGNNVIEAAFIGLSAGASATGYHQIGKQLIKKDDTTPVEQTEFYEDVDGVDEVDLEPVEPADDTDTSTNETDE